jgi:hypothetical protein
LAIGSKSAPGAQGRDRRPRDLPELQQKDYCSNTSGGDNIISYFTRREGAAGAMKYRTLILMFLLLMIVAAASYLLLSKKISDQRIPPGIEIQRDNLKIG